MLVSTVTAEGNPGEWTQEAVTLAPGERGAAKVTVMPAGFGHWSRVFTLTTNDPRQVKVRMLLSASIEPRLQVEPRRFDLGSLPAGSDTCLVVQVASRVEEPFSVLGVDVDPPLTRGGSDRIASVLDAEFHRSPGAAESWELRLCLRADAPPGRLSETVRIRTSDPVVPTVEIAVLGTLTGGLRYPPRIELVSPFEGLGAEAIVPIRREQGPPFRVTGLSVNDPHLRTELVTVSEGEAYEVKVTLLPDMPAGLHSPLLLVETDRPDQPQLAIVLLVRMGRAGRLGGGRP